MPEKSYAFFIFRKFITIRIHIPSGNPRGRGKCLISDILCAIDAHQRRPARVLINPEYDSNPLAITIHVDVSLYQTLDIDVLPRKSTLKSASLTIEFSPCSTAQCSERLSIVLKQFFQSAKAVRFRGKISKRSVIFLWFLLHLRVFDQKIFGSDTLKIW